MSTRNEAEFFEQEGKTSWDKKGHLDNMFQSAATQHNTNLNVLECFDLTLRISFAPTSDSVNDSVNIQFYTCKLQQALLVT